MLKANTLFNPRLYPENAVNRRNVVLKQMEKYSYLTAAVADSLCRLPLKLDYNKYDITGPADYFLVRVRKEAEQILQETHPVKGKKWDIEKDGLIITTTISLPLQNAANEAFKTHLSSDAEKARRTIQYTIRKEITEEYPRQPQAGCDHTAGRAAGHGSGYRRHQGMGWRD